MRVTARLANGDLRAAVLHEGAGGVLSIAEAHHDLSSAELPGIFTGGFTDWHVHTALIDADQLADGVIDHVVDLGGVPDRVRALRDRLRGSVSIRYAGAFLTAPGGYPSTRAWAPAGSWEEIADTGEAVVAVHRQAAHGASGIKIACNADAGPVLSDALIRAIVEAARVLGLPVVAHAEGAGQALRLHRLGVSTLTHTPFTEELDAATIAELAREGTWYSTLDIHGWGEPTADYHRAVQNLAAFARAGGLVRYATDMGNGPVPVGLNPREIAGLAAAGLGPCAQLSALAAASPFALGARLVYVPVGADGAWDVAAAEHFTAEDERWRTALAREREHTTMREVR